MKPTISPGFAAGSDYPCAVSTLGTLLTYSQVANGQMTYRNWVEAIAAGRTVVSRNGQNEFLALTVNGNKTPGDEIALLEARLDSLAREEADLRARLALLRTHQGLPTAIGSPPSPLSRQERIALFLSNLAEEMMTLGSTSIRRFFNPSGFRSVPSGTATAPAFNMP